PPVSQSVEVVSASIKTSVPLRQNDVFGGQLDLGIASSKAAQPSASTIHFAIGSMKQSEMPEAPRETLYAQLAEAPIDPSSAPEKIAIADEDLADLCFAGLSQDSVSL